MSADGSRICGVDDRLGAAGQMCRWPQPDITWSIVQQLPNIQPDSFKAAAELAWSFWTSVCGIRPRFVNSNQANVIIGTQQGRPGGVLADSELPCGASMQSRLLQRYDVAEQWVIAENPPQSKFDLVRVICHELGHVIGIPHIGTGNLMAPEYSRQIRKPVSGDIAEAVSRYGLPTAPPPPPPPTPGEFVLIAEILEKNGVLFARRNGVITQI